MSILQLQQEPMFKFNAAGQPLVYTVSAEDSVLNETNVKFICQIWGGRTINDFYKLATLKTTPNGAGVGMFDVSTIIESYVGPTYQGKRGTDDEHSNGKSTFKNVWWRNTKPHTIHQIDKYCTNTKNMFMYEVYFYIEYMDQVTGMIVEDPVQGDYRGGNLVYNGVLGNHQNLTSNAQVQNHFARFGYQPQDFQYASGDGDYLIRDTFGSGASYTQGGKFVTNMPMYGQKIREDDYGTIAFFNCIDNRNCLTTHWNGLGNLATCPTLGGTGTNNIPGIALRFKDENGVVVANYYYPNEPTDGGASYNTASEDCAVNMVYFGYGLANMKGRGETWPSSACNYDVYPSDGTNASAPSGGGGTGGSGGSGGGTPSDDDDDALAMKMVPPTDPCECLRCDEEPYVGKWRWCDDGSCIYDSERECQDAHPTIPRTWDCDGKNNCYEVFDGSGQFATELLCIDACGSSPAGPCECKECDHPKGKWRCDDGTFYGPCIYDSLKDCEEANGHEPEPEPPLSWYTPIGRIYNFGIINDDCHGFESVRLTWLNRMGAWDYYTFTKKSTQKTKTKGVTYNQLGGTWNEELWMPHDHLGGNKIFMNTSKTSYDLNTDYVSEEIAAWFQEMFTSSDVYIMDQFTEDEPVPNFGGVGNPPNYLRKYIQPVTVGSKSYTKKTRANDKLIKYKFKVDLCIPDNIQKA